MVTASIDQAISDATMIALANPPSALVRPYFDKNLKDKKLLQTTIGGVDNFEKEVEEFKKNGIVMRELLAKRFEAEDVTQQDLYLLDKLITAIEDKARTTSQEGHEGEKKVRKLFNRIAQSAPNIKNELKEQLDRAALLTMSSINELTERALFVRALKAKYSPKENVSPLFTNKTDLEKYLNRLIA